MQKIKCKYCNQTLMIARKADCEIKCHRCKRINVINLEIKKTERRAAPEE